MIIWQCASKNKFVMTCPEQSYFAQFLDRRRWRKVLNTHLCWERVDIQSLMLFRGLDPQGGKSVGLKQEKYMFLQFIFGNTKIQN